MARMFRLDEFRYDEQIDAPEVGVFLGGSSEPMSRDEAIELAHRQGANLVAWWPGEGDCPSCIISKVSEPVRWERTTFDPKAAPSLDEHLWFDSTCGGRDYLLPENGHTFNGRMSAWCPAKHVAYNVSLSEMGEMSTEARYFVKGFLAGDGPSPPYDDDGDVAPDDLLAWRAAVARFNRTGSWYARWGTCAVCGCVLLPDIAGDRCEEHLMPADEGQRLD